MKSKTMCDLCEQSKPDEKLKLVGVDVGDGSTGQLAICADCMIDLDKDFT